MSFLFKLYTALAAIATEAQNGAQLARSVWLLLETQVSAFVRAVNYDRAV
jgi:hypothetical protein